MGTIYSLVLIRNESSMNKHLHSLTPSALILRIHRRKISYGQNEKLSKFRYCEMTSGIEIVMSYGSNLWPTYPLLIIADHRSKISCDKKDVSRILFCYTIFQGVFLKKMHLLPIALTITKVHRKIRRLNWLNYSVYQFHLSVRFQTIFQTV